VSSQIELMKHAPRVVANDQLDWNACFSRNNNGRESSQMRTKDLEPAETLFRLGSFLTLSDLKPEG